MGLYINKQEVRSELQERVAAELRAKANSTSFTEDDKKPLNDAEDFAYMKGTKKTTSLAWVWIVIALAIIGAAIWLIVVSLNRK